MKPLIPNKHNTRTRFFSRRLLLGGAGVCALLALFAFGFGWEQETLTRSAHTLGAPVWHARESLLSVAYVAFESVSTKESLVRENKALQEELSRLRRENFQTKILASENKKLKTMLGRTPSETTVLVSVLRGPDASPYDTLVIDAGEKAGVTAGALARVQGGVAIGFVKEVYAESALVSLFSAYGEELGVILGQATTTHVTAIGQGDGMFMISVPGSFLVAEGDPIRVPSLMGELVASVEEIQKDASGAFSKVYFRTPVNLSSVRFVEIVQGAPWRPHDE